MIVVLVVGYVLVMALVAGLGAFVFVGWVLTR